MSERLSIVFFGSGPVAAGSLSLLNKDFEIEAVITKPSTEQQMRSVCPEAKIFVVSTRTELDKLMEQNNFSSLVGVLIDFGIIVSQKVIDYFDYGIVNSHFSLLPELRGADPITFAILEGKEKTGVSLMLLVEKMDEGPLIGVGELTISKDETTPSLTEKLISLSYELLVKYLPLYLNSAIKPVQQTELNTSYTRKLTKLDGLIDWSKPALQIEREVRAFKGWPKSHTKLGDIDCTIEDVAVLKKYSGIPGELFLENNSLFGIYCGDDALEIKTLRPSGKKSMDSRSFLAGYKDRIGLK